jgi:hypothetical protein
MNDEVTERQWVHLEKVIGWAGRIRETLEPISLGRAGDVHFRPSSGGVAMVGLQADRPQRGKSGFRDLDRLAREFEDLYERHCVSVSQGRPTPEKQLQSWLTADAYRHERRMVALDSALADGVETLFVADELALPLAGNRRVVCDMLALRRAPNGTCRPAVIELKAAREMTRLIEQVQGYSACVEALSEHFERLFTSVLGYDITFAGPPEQWIVWPYAGEIVDPREDALAEQGIRLLGYYEDGAGFSLRAGRAL